MKKSDKSDSFSRTLIAGYLYDRSDKDRVYVLFAYDKYTTICFAFQGGFDMAIRMTSYAAHFIQIGCSFVSLGAISAANDAAKSVNPEMPTLVKIRICLRKAFLGAATSPVYVPTKLYRITKEQMHRLRDQP